MPALVDRSQNMRLNLRITWKNFNSTTLLLFAVFAICIQPARAQSQDSRKQDIQQLKNELQQLDQKMDEIKAKINALEAAPPSRPTTPPRNPAEAQKTPEQPQPQVAIPSEAIVAQPQLGAVPLEGEITEAEHSFNIYGFTMLDSGYDFNQVDPLWFDVVRPTKLPSFTNQFAPSGNVYAGVRQTRFGVKSSTTTALGDLNTVFDFELFGTGIDAGQTTLR